MESETLPTTEATLAAIHSRGALEDWNEIESERTVIYLDGRALRAKRCVILQKQELQLSEQEIADRREVAQQIVSLKEDEVDVLLDDFSRQIDEHLQKEKIDIDQLQQDVYLLLMLMMRKAGRYDKLLEELSLRKVEITSREIKGLSESKSQLMLTLVGNGMMIVGAAIAFAPLLSNDSLRRTMQIAQPFSSGCGNVGQSFTGIANYFGQRNNATGSQLQTVNQSIVQSQASSSSNSARQEMELVKGAERNFKEAIDRIYSLFHAFANAIAPSSS